MVHQVICAILFVLLCNTSLTAAARLLRADSGHAAQSTVVGTVAFDLDDTAVLAAVSQLEGQTPLPPPKPDQKGSLVTGSIAFDLKDPTIRAQLQQYATAQAAHSTGSKVTASIAFDLNDPAVLQQLAAATRGAARSSQVQGSIAFDLQDPTVLAAMKAAKAEGEEAEGSTVIGTVEFDVPGSAYLADLQQQIIGSGEQLLETAAAATQAHLRGGSTVEGSIAFDVNDPAILAQLQQHH